MTEGQGMRRGMAALAVLVLLIAPWRPASAACDDCSCSLEEHARTQEFEAEQHVETQMHFGTAAPIPNRGPIPMDIGTGKLGEDEEWWINTIFGKYILPAMQGMTEQLVGTMMNQAMSIGAMMDATNELQTQLLYQQLAAEAHKDYHPSNGMCVIGTGIRSLAGAERNGLLAASVLNEHALKRQLGNGDVSGAEGREGSGGDRFDRLQHFRSNYCDYDDNDRTAIAGTGLSSLCEQAARNPLDNLNSDVDFGRLVAVPDTIDVDMLNVAQGKPDPLFALQKNLYGHDIMTRLTNREIKQDNALDEVLDYRVAAAKRSVAVASFDSIVGLKLMGTPEGSGTGMGSADTLEYMSLIMQDLGIPDTEIKAVLGDRPSYYAQLRFLAKRLLQRPEFYMDLYDKPANVDRKRVALQAINSILKREIFNSYARSEAMLSQILELKVEQQQNAAEASVRNLPGDRE